MSLARDLPGKSLFNAEEMKSLLIHHCCAERNKGTIDFVFEVINCGAKPGLEFKGHIPIARTSGCRAAPGS